MFKTREIARKKALDGWQQPMLVWGLGVDDCPLSRVVVGFDSAHPQANSTASLQQSHMELKPRAPRPGLGVSH